MQHAYKQLSKQPEILRVDIKQSNINSTRICLQLSNDTIRYVVTKLL
jgi:hypothetical protein